MTFKQALKELVELTRLTISDRLLIWAYKIAPPSDEKIILDRALGSYWKATQPAADLRLKKSEQDITSWSDKS
ncbi:hypothetical protein ACQU0X_25785 [Pseudovibrio ascidiaceicola]|uniref:hypothetical protein n=1 Tax=Pseudovibrio ascidiaceicola TaxID=285279 RepID=UPI003D3680B0